MTPERIKVIREWISIPFDPAISKSFDADHELHRRGELLGECLDEIERLQSEIQRLSKSSVLRKWANGYYRNKGDDE